MNNDLISRSELLEKSMPAREFARNCPDLHVVSTNSVRRAPAVPITGDTSDGYHTFNELYHHRAVLFSVIVKAFPDKAWKARKHHDGSMYDGMFIVGVETPDGQATYHYDVDPYWDMFDCPEVELAPEWDGHTAEQAIERIGKLELGRVHGCWIEMCFSDTHKSAGFKCSVCGLGSKKKFAYCHCGARMDLEEELWWKMQEET